MYKYTIAVLLKKKQELSNMVTCSNCQKQKQECLQEMIIISKAINILQKDSRNQSC